MCPNCRSTNLEVYVWESSDGAFEDHRYTCRDCGNIHWVDGPDA